MTVALSTASKNASVDAVTGLLNSGTIEVYSGTKAATPATAIGAQVLLATLTFNSTAFGAASGGVGTANAVTSGTGTAGASTGTVATWARIKRSSGNGSGVVMDVDVATSGSDLNLSSTTIAQNDVVSCSSFTITQP